MNTSVNAVAISKPLHNTRPVSHGLYHSGSLDPNSTITFDGSGSYDTDIDDLGQTPKWEWDFDYDDVFNVDVSTTSALVTWQFS